MRLLTYLTALIVAIYAATPIYFIVVMAVMAEREFTQTPTPLFPSHIDLAAVNWVVFHPNTASLGLVNSLIIAVPVTLVTMLVAIPAGYALGRFKLRWKHAFLGMLLLGRTVPPIVIIIPYYIFFLSLRLRGTYQGLILTHLLLTLPLAVWVLMGFFATLPRDLEKAARMDGCGRLQAFRRVILPMARPGIVAATILVFLTSWNEFLFGWLLATGTPVQPFLPAISTWGGRGLMAATLVGNILPAIAVGAVLQRYIQRLGIVDPTSVMV
jgi:multiple sugar transport system permease protein